MITTKEMRLAKMLRKAFPNDDRFKFADGILNSLQDVREIVSSVANEPSKDNTGCDFIIKDSLIDSATQYFWQKSGGLVHHGEAELLGMALHQISHIGIMHSDLCKMFQEHDNQLMELKRLLEAEPRRIHIKSDNSSGLSCIITSDLLKRRIWNCLCDGINYDENPLLDIKLLTSDLGEFICNFEKTANILLRQSAGKVASYVFLGDLIYLFEGLAPNPDKWEWMKDKEKYDVVKGWVKQYKKHQSRISD